MSFRRNTISKVVALSLATLITAGCGQSSQDQASSEAVQVQPGAVPVNLLVGEGFSNPIGYYESTPRFSWHLDPNAKAEFQTAYQIHVAESASALANNQLLWDSGKVESEQTSWIDYQGQALGSRQQVVWRVKTWNKADQSSSWSETQRIELGLLANSDWQGSWIGHPDTQLSQSPSQALLATPQYFRKDFALSGDITQARLYITAKGLFKPFINGQQVSEEDVMTPGWTPYAKRIETLTYDVTSLLQQGDNAIGASLAGGWYSGRAFDQFEQDHRKPPRLLAQLEVTYADGRSQVIATDDTWQSSQQGPIRFASIYDGERYDQNLAMPGWNSANFAAKDWAKSVVEPLEQEVLLEPKRHAPIRITEQMPVQSIVSNKDGVVIFDFGQNMVGVPKLNLPVVEGQELKVRFAEALHKGEFYTDNYRSAHSTNYFIPSKTGVIEYQPTYTYHGYRYIEISGFDKSQQPQKSWATAMIQHSDVDLHASFESSHPKLNKLSQNIVWGLRSNFYDIPLDCPQRDERLGWTGDAQVFATPSMYMADVYGFWSAWLQSIREEQKPDGKIPLYIPWVDWKVKWTSSGWGDVVTIIPWELYQLTGDKQILEDNYQMMQGWVGYHQQKSDKLISNMMTFGDWLQPFPVIEKEGDNGNRGNTDFNLIGTAYFARSVELTMKTAEVLNKQQDVVRLAKLHQDIKQAYMATFYDEQLNTLTGLPTQTGYLLGLAYDLFPDDKRAVAMDKLIGLMQDADNHLRTGFLGTPLLSQVLQEEGRSDLIYSLLFKETYPSWFYSINNGATTTWERWNSYSLEDGFNPQGMNSLNHYAYGTISRWFYEGILGITAVEPGFKHIRIEPQFGTQLTQAKGGYETPNGEVTVSWTISAGQLAMELVVPKNTTADVVLPKVTASTLLLNGEKVGMNKAAGLTPGRYQLSGAIAL